LISKENLLFKNSPIPRRKPSLKLKNLRKESLRKRVHIFLFLEILKEKDDEKDIALGTSKTNYNDPRISVAWCKKNEVKIEKVFPKNLLSKFLWAMYTDAEWEF
jgi:DNA topoisomerase-1